MEKAFIYGVSVEGDNFTDRVKETKRLKLNFENGLNTIIISPRRLGKTSLVKKVKSSIDNPDILVVFLDIYDCRSEYDFYNKLSAAVLKQTSNKMTMLFENAKDFMARLSPKISFGSDPETDYSISLGITPKTHNPEEILNLPEIIAKKKNVHIVICIDEFQQVGEFPDTLTVQKRMRSVWQHQQNVSYCLFGSKKHMMTNLFQDKRMPFYQFGEMIFLDKIPTEDWVKFIQSRFELKGKTISEGLCMKICELTERHSSYVQQLSWNVLAETAGSTTENDFDNAVETILSQCSALFVQQIEGLTSHQMNFMRAIANGIHDKFGSKDVMESYDFGTKTNINRIKNTLIFNELIEIVDGGLYFADPIFAIWFKKKCL
ncbi:MAG: ATP-binding protein [Bacteroidales bacterium]|nr:ATP-binding protein [Bacteroidales bacterium]